MTSMIKNHNERPKSELGGLPPVQFRLQIKGTFEFVEEAPPK